MGIFTFPWVICRNSIVLILCHLLILAILSTFIIILSPNLPILVPWNNNSQVFSMLKIWKFCVKSQWIFLLEKILELLLYECTLWIFKREVCNDTGFHKLISPKEYFLKWQLLPYIKGMSSNCYHVSNQHQFWKCSSTFHSSF